MSLNVSFRFLPKSHVRNVFKWLKLISSTSRMIFSYDLFYCIRTLDTDGRKYCSVSSYEIRLCLLNWDTHKISCVHYECLFAISFLFSFVHVHCSLIFVGLTLAIYCLKTIWSGKRPGQFQMICHLIFFSINNFLLTATFFSLIWIAIYIYFSFFLTSLAAINKW